LNTLAGDDSVQAVVLGGGALGFSQGYNPVRPELRDGEISLSDLCLQVEDFPKPVVACLTGATLGAGFELALAAHVRVAQRSAVVGMTEIALGLVPGAGGTQRLPRLVGAQTALTMLLSGELAAVSDPRLSAVFDQIVEDGAEQAAVEYAVNLASGTIRWRKTRDRTDGFAEPLAYQEAIKACRAAFDDTTREAQHAVVKAVENALVLPFAAGSAMEEDLYQSCLNSDVAQGHRHLLLAQRRLMNLPESASAKPLPVATLGVVGSGPSAVALVLAALENRMPTIWFEREAATVQRASARLDLELERRNISSEQRGDMKQQLKLTHDPRHLIEAELVVEAVADTQATKCQVMEWLSGFMPAAAILVTNSATLSVDATAQSSERPSQVVGMYLAPGGKRAQLVELIPGSKSTASSIVTLHSVLQKIGLPAVRCGSLGGTIGARMMAACKDAAAFAVELGATPAQVDAALVRFGKTNGVFAAMDGVGITEELARSEQLFRPELYPNSHLAALKELLSQDRTGRDVGKGFYDWIDDAPVPRAADRPGQDAPDEDTIVKLCLGAMMNEAARLLREEIALRPSDIDMVMVRHHGFPAWRGGVLNAAEQLGLFSLQRAMAAFADAKPRLFAADPGIDALIRNGEGFDVLNGTGNKRRKIAG
jgi:3-hydroxyacyl-CoA dehydrogenase